MEIFKAFAVAHLLGMLFNYLTTVYTLMRCHYIRNPKPAFIDDINGFIILWYAIKIPFSAVWKNPKDKWVYLAGWFVAFELTFAQAREIDSTKEKYGR